MDDLSTYPTDIKLYEKIRVIGQGSFGHVWEAKIKLGPHKDEHVALKEVDLEDLGDKNLENLSVKIILTKQQEITIMSSIQHENLIRTYSTCTSGHKISIVMPLMNAGSLNHILCYKFPQGIKDVSIIATIMRDCLEGLKCLNMNNLYHRDIKAGNILLSTDGLVKLGDFGVAACIKPDAKKNSFVGSLNWMAPEVIAREDYDYKIDIWSLGITAIEIAEGRPPFYGMNQLDIMREIKFDDSPPSLKSPLKWDPSFIEFVNSCLIKDPKARPDAEAVLKLNKKFFALAKDKKYLRETLLKNIPSVQERFGKVPFKDEEVEENVKNDDYVNWNFEINEDSNGMDENYFPNEKTVDKLTDKFDKLSSIEKNSKDNSSYGKKEEISKRNIQENFKNMFDEEA